MMARMNEARLFPYKRVAGRTYRIEVFPPRRRRGARGRPAIVWFSGGGWRFGGLGVYDRQCAYLASRGMVAACAEFRAAGRGRYTAAWAAEDAKAAVRWLRVNARRLGVDPGRIVAAGESSGATMAAQTALCPGFEPADEPLGLSSVPNALVLLDPPMDWRTLGKLFMRRMGMPEEESRRLTPNLHLRPDMPPAFLAFSREDFLIRGLRETARLVRRLRLPVRVREVRAQPHGFFKVTPWNEISTGWIDRWLVSIGFLRGRPSIEPPALPFDRGKPVFGRGLPPLPSTAWWWKEAHRFRGLDPFIRGLSFAPLRGGRLGAMVVFKAGLRPGRARMLRIAAAVSAALSASRRGLDPVRRLLVCFIAFPHAPVAVWERGILRKLS